MGADNHPSELQGDGVKNVVMAALLGACGSAYAVDGGPFLAMCEKALTPPGVSVASKEAFQAGYCIGALDAAFEGINLESLWANKGLTLCPKEDRKDPLELVRVVTRHLRENPQEHTRPASMAVRAALTRAYPCR